MRVALISLALGMTAASVLPEQGPRAITRFVSAGRTCAVLQAAYTAATQHKALIYPQEVRSGARMLKLDKMVPEYRAKLALTAREFNDLAVQENRYSVSNFNPICKWKGVPGPSADDERHATFVTFTSPIFSTSKRLAILDVSFRETGIFGYGLICVVRKRHEGWEGKCQMSWIT